MSADDAPVYQPPGVGITSARLEMLRAGQALRRLSVLTPDGWKCRMPVHLEYRPLERTTVVQFGLSVYVIDR